MLRSSPSVSIFKGKKWQKTVSIVRRGGKLWWPKLEIPNAEAKLDMSPQLLPLLLLKPNSAGAPTYVSTYSTSQAHSSGSVAAESLFWHTVQNIQEK